MATHEKTSNVSTSKDHPWGALTGLAIGAVIIFSLVWTSAMFAGEKIAEFYAKDHARDWANSVVDSFANKKGVFTGHRLEIRDRYALNDFQKGTSIYRYSVLNAEGRVFASSKMEETGRLEKRKFFINNLKRGQIISIRADVSEGDIDGFIQQPNSENSNQAQKLRQVIEVAIPIMNDGKFIGAIVVLDDISNLLAWSNEKSKLLASALCAALTLVFAGVAAMIGAYGTARSKQNDALQQAKHAAENSEREALEMSAQLRTMNDDIGNLNIELNTNMKILRQTQDEVIRKGKLSQLGQLTATVAHDIRNPLGSVRTSAFLLRRKFAAENPTMDKPLTRIEKGVERCDGIITQLLDFARSRDLHIKTQNLDEWLVNLVREQAEQLPEEIAFECALGLDDTEVAFDGDNLARALINFISNASEAMIGKGSNKPKEPTAHPAIRIATVLTERGVEISVTDNGPGIPEKLIGKILDPLFTTKSFGVGLGLPSVEKIFEQHGGGMEIKSTEGYGATFTGWIAIDETSGTDDKDSDQADETIAA